jgi:hypothetical protein
METLQPFPTGTTSRAIFVVADGLYSHYFLVSVPKTPFIGFAIASESEHDCWMFAIAFLFVRVLLLQVATTA